MYPKASNDTNRRRQLQQYNKLTYKQQTTIA